MAKMGRPRKDPKDLKESVTSALPPVMVRELEAIALSQRRTRSQVVELLLQRSLAAFQRDGLLEEPAPPSRPEPRGVVSMQVVEPREKPPVPKAVKNKAKVS